MRTNSWTRRAMGAVPALLLASTGLAATLPPTSMLDDLPDETTSAAVAPSPPPVHVPDAPEGDVPPAPVTSPPVLDLDAGRPPEAAIPTPIEPGEAPGSRSDIGNPDARVSDRGEEPRRGESLLGPAEDASGPTVTSAGTRGRRLPATERTESRRTLPTPGTATVIDLVASERTIVPLGALAALVTFLLAQTFLDRRDPKLHGAAVEVDRPLSFESDGRHL